jgi:ABC-2 type transport system ATP-binding protein
MKRRATICSTLAATALAVAPLTVPAFTVPAAGAAAVIATVTDGCFASVPDPGTTEEVQICYSVFKPTGASRKQKVPMLVHSHGWGGSRTTDPASLKRYLNAGYGVISFDQRGWGESGGHAYVEDPRVEGHDVRKLVDVVSKLRWVTKDRPGDPRLGAVGGSYGGGYQFLAAFEELRVGGRPVFDALAPEITWNDLSDSLAPEGVVRTEWAAALSAASLPSDALPTSVYLALVEGVATGEWPDGTLPGSANLVEFFERNGPKWHTSQGRKLDIPVLFGQGTTDGLFNLQQGLTNWRTALTAKARRNSIFVGYNGGHVLPSVFPRGVNITSDPCSIKLGSKDFQGLSIRFFNEKLKGRDTGLTGWNKFHLATPGDTCTTVGSVTPDRTVGIDPVTTTTVVGPPVTTELAKGPLRIAGSSHLTADVTTVTPGSRAFYGLAVGTSPLDATLVQNNVMPLNEPTPVTQQRRRIELPAVAVDVPKGQSLYLLTTAFSDTFAVMGSRVPGIVTLDNVKVHLPWVG